MPRIYVACLASYNNGTLFGEWIDAAQSEEQIRADINKMLRQSPYPNVTRRDYRCETCRIEFARTLSGFQPEQREEGWRPECPECSETTAVKPEGAPYPSAEEYAIHDHEGFDGVDIGEYSSLEAIAEIAAALAEHGEAYAAFLKYHGREYGSVERFTEAYRGTYDSAADYVEEFHKETGTEIPKALENYINWESMARDWDMSGDINAIDLPSGKVAIFDGHA